MIKNFDLMHLSTRRDRSDLSEMFAITNGPSSKLIAQSSQGEHPQN